MQTTGTTRTQQEHNKTKKRKTLKLQVFITSNSPCRLHGLVHFSQKPVSFGALFSKAEIEILERTLSAYCYFAPALLAGLPDKRFQ